MSQENTLLATRWFTEVWNDRRADLIPEFAAPECCGHVASGDFFQLEEFTAMYERFMEAFPDLHVTIESTITERDEVVVRWSATGTHGGGGLGFEATGKPIEMHGLTWMRIRDGKFVEARDCSNQGRVFQDLAAACTG